MKYRGYDIEKLAGGWVISKDGARPVCSQPSEEFAKHWVDQQLKKKE